MLGMGLEIYYQAFFHLSTERKYECGQIPWSSVEFYGSSKNFDLEELIDLHYFIREMDEVYLEYIREKRKAKQTT